MTERIPAVSEVPVLDWNTDRDPGDPISPVPDHVAVQRSGCPLARARIWDGSTPWLVTRHEDYRLVTSDRRFSADRDRPGYPLKNSGYRTKDKTFLTMDDPEHAPYRRLWAKHLSARRMEELRPEMQRITDDAIDDMLAGPNPADLIETFALRVPAEILAALFGVPADDRQAFLDLASTMSSAKSTLAETQAAWARLREYADALVAERERAPQDDVITRFLEEGVGGGVLTRAELVRIVIALLTAAHDTSTGMIALGTVALLRHPDQLALLRERSDDAQFVANATEELLRFVAPTQTGRRRVAVADVEVGGQVIRAGEGVIALDNVSSRDPQVFPDPDRLDLTRAEARQHNAFGFGTHSCAGQALARVELQVVFSTLYRRIPTLRLAVPEEELPFRDDTIIYVIDRMPVTW